VKAPKDQEKLLEGVNRVTDGIEADLLPV